MKDTYSVSYGKNAEYPARRYSYNLRLEKIKTHLGGCEDVLNIGCASCDYDIDLKETGKRMVSLDLDQDYLKIAQSKDASLVLVMADALHLPFSDESFDAVILANSYRYFIDPVEPLREIRRILKNDGKVVLLDHNRHCPDSLLIRKDVIRYYTVPELRRMLDDCGLRFLGSEYLLVPVFFTPIQLLRIVGRIGDLIASTFIGEILPEMLINARKQDSMVNLQ